MLALKASDLLPVFGGYPKEGSVIFMENSVPRPLDGLLELFTNSPLSHVAIFLYYENQPKIYEAYPPRVRKMSYIQYVEEVLPSWEKKFWTRRLGGLNTFWWEPPNGLLDEQALKLMRAKAENLLGTPYNMICNWLRENPNKVHCSEFVSLVYEEAGFITSDKGRESPGSLFRKLTKLGT